MTYTSKEARHKDAARNVILNRALDDLEQIISNHDPGTDVPIKDGVWDRLDRLACEIECRERDALRDSLKVADDNCRKYATAVNFALSEVRAWAAEVETLRAQLQAARDEALEEAAERIEGQAPFTEGQMQNTPLLIQLNNIHGVNRSVNCRRDATLIRALKSTNTEGEG
ncbi:hypothetical protein MACH17_18090 [Phaeobacter inhibens]|uniref:hypothetical protein n=1 Tax=Phaeobacter inhibens TaxID=221822 RepID=UPI00276BBF78|nr:hypothetical protein [Phaeobacter inhibens]GLO70292.1 hypothetical protein MACH17_18090 [Phaeobacter inhibens]